MVKRELTDIDINHTKPEVNKFESPGDGITLDQWIRTGTSGNCLLNNTSAHSLLEITSDNDSNILCITARTRSEFERRYGCKLHHSEPYITVVNFSSMNFWISDLTDDNIDGGQVIHKNRLLYEYIRKSLKYNHYDYLLIDGLEEYFLAGDFNSIWKELEDIKDLILENKSKLVLLLDKNFFTEQQYALLGRYMDFVNN